MKKNIIILFFALILMVSPSKAKASCQLSYDRIESTKNVPECLKIKYSDECGGNRNITLTNNCKQNFYFYDLFGDLDRNSILAIGQTQEIQHQVNQSCTDWWGCEKEKKYSFWSVQMRGTKDLADVNIDGRVTQGNPPSSTNTILIIIRFSFLLLSLIFLIITIILTFKKYILQKNIRGSKIIATLVLSPIFLLIFIAVNYFTGLK